MTRCERTPQTAVKTSCLHGFRANYAEEVTPMKIKVRKNSNYLGTLLG